MGSGFAREGGIQFLTLGHACMAARVMVRESELGPDPPAARLKPGRQRQSATAGDEALHHR